MSVIIANENRLNTLSRQLEEAKPNLFKINPSTLRELEQRLSSAQREVVRVTTEIEHACNLSVQHAELAQMQSQLQEAKATSRQKEKLESEVLALSEHLQKLMHSKSNLEGDLQRTQSALQNAKRELKSSTYTHDSAKKQLDEVTAALQAHREAIVIEFENNKRAIETQCALQLKAEKHRFDTEISKCTAAFKQFLYNSLQL